MRKKDIRRKETRASRLRLIALKGKDLRDLQCRICNKKLKDPDWYASLIISTSRKGMWESDNLGIYCEKCFQDKRSVKISARIPYGEQMRIESWRDKHMPGYTKADLIRYALATLIEDDDLKVEFFESYREMISEEARKLAHSAESLLAKL